VGVFADANCIAATARRLGTELRFVTDGRDAATAGLLPDWYPFRHDAADPVLITHTSGTTGSPKAVMMSHEGFIAAHRHRLRLPLPNGSERMLSALPGSHNSSLTSIILGLLNGSQMHVLASQRPEAVLGAIRDFRPSMVLGFAKVLGDLAEQDLAQRDMGSVQLWFNSGDAVHESQIRKLVAVGSHYWADRGGTRLMDGSRFVDGLGSSEMGHNLFFHLHRPELVRYGRCVGKPYQFVQAAILSEDGEILPPGEVGRLGVRSPTLSPGYWNDTTLTWRSRLRGYFITGDLAYQDAHGDFYQIDRISDAIVTPEGPLYTVMAEERLLAECPDLVECTIVALASREGVEPAAFLQLRDGPFDRDAWLRRLDMTLRRSGIPPVSRAYRVEPGQLPVGVTGKVRKAQLREEWRDLIGNQA
jgi:acyl-coenzyme A synthetase/AMP-(fatty) acid ligase